jgi:hypothetical protein
VLDNYLVSYSLSGDRQTCSSACTVSVCVVQLYPKPEYDSIMENVAAILKLQYADRLKQRRQCTYSEILRRISLTVLTMERQYYVWFVCVCL